MAASWMHPLIIHHEAEYFAGAEKVLGYFLEGLKSEGIEFTAAAVRESRMAELIPAGVDTCWLPANSKFSARAFARQVQALRRHKRGRPFDLVHGWAARDWELTAAAGKLGGVPAVGTLHDHPRAPFISKGRQRLMRAAANWGLDKVVCVSEAVRRACAEAGYRLEGLEVVHNGLPSGPTAGSTPGRAGFRFGYLGQFTERKGLRGLFEIVDAFAQSANAPWELALAGDAQEPEGRKLVQDLHRVYSVRPWWSRVQWLGWVKKPAEFLASLDLLLCPSAEFDPFPTVLLEAGQAGVPVLAADVGGVREIIEDGATGWLFGAQAWKDAAGQLQRLCQAAELVRQAGDRAKKRVEQEFAIGRMVADYLRVYSGLAHCRK